jgi:hypothetical protein
MTQPSCSLSYCGSLKCRRAGLGTRFVALCCGAGLCLPYSFRDQSKAKYTKPLPPDSSTVMSSFRNHIAFNEKHCRGRLDAVFVKS